eukprot:1603270-Rhodomonas_salina.1
MEQCLLSVDDSHTRDWFQHWFLPRAQDDDSMTGELTSCRSSSTHSDEQRDTTAHASPGQGTLDAESDDSERGRGGHCPTKGSA